MNSRENALTNVCQQSDSESSDIIKLHTRMASIGQPAAGMTPVCSSCCTWLWVMWGFTTLTPGTRLCVVVFVPPNLLIGQGNLKLLSASILFFKIIWTECRIGLLDFSSSWNSNPVFHMQMFHFGDQVTRVYNSSTMDTSLLLSINQSASQWIKQMCNKWQHYRLQFWTIMHWLVPCL